MKFWQRMAHQFLKLRRQLRKRSKAIIALAAVVVFFTTYALILPAITEDAETAANDPAMSVGTTSVAGTDTAGEGGNGEVTEGSVDQQNPETAEENKEQPAQAETATETAAAENAEASDLISENTTLTDRNAESGYTISAAVTADAKFKNDTKLTTSEISKDKEETKDTYQAYLDKAQTALQATNTTVADAHFYDISFVSGTEKEEPQAAVTTTIQFDNPIELKDGQDIQIAHIDADNNLTILDKTAAAVATTETADHKIGSVSFNANQFSVYGVIVTQSKTDEKAAESTTADDEKQAISDNNAVSENAASDAKDTVSGNATPAGEDTVKVNDDVTVKVSYDEKAGLPEGTKLSVKEVSDADQYAKATKEALGKDVEILGEKYYDISFTKDGKEIEPTGGVNVKITLSGDEKMTAGNDVKVVHFADGEDTPDVLDATVTGGKVVETEAPATKNVVKRLLRAAAPKKATSKDSDSVVRFTADSFSIYGIVDTKDTSKTKEYRRTYTFQNDDGSEYKFSLTKNPKASGNETPVSEETSQQIVKNGGQLLDVGIPAPVKKTDPTQKHPDSYGRKFLGWGKVREDGSVDTTNLISTFPYQVNMGNDVTADDSVTLRAVYSTQIYITFFDVVDDPQNTSKLVPIIKTISVESGTPVDLSQYTAIPERNDQGFLGWSKKKIKAGEGNVSDAIASPATFTHDTALYPVIGTGYWLNFDKNDNDGGDTKATYTDSKFITGNVKSTDKPSKDPTRQGYQFDGWYRDKDCTREFRFDGSVTKDPNDTEITAYAKWTPANVNYTVIIWKQKVTDSVNAEKTGTETYDFEASVSLTATTGSTITVPSEYSSIRNGQKVTLNGKTYDFTGFHYDTGNHSHQDAEKTKTIAADGSTTFNVYYNRNIITINFNSQTNYYNEYLMNESGDYVGKLTYKGLYEAPLDFKWPNKYYKRSSNGRPYTYTPDDCLFQYGTTVLTFVGNYILPTPTSTSIDLYVVAAGRYPVNFYQQSVDGNWPENPSTSININKGNFSITDKYTGFKAIKYQTRNYYGQWSDDINLRDPDPNGIYTTVDNDDFYALNIYFQRKFYNLTFVDSMNSNQLGMASVIYEGDLSDYVNRGNKDADNYVKNITHEGYEFSGWYSDPECTHRFDFSGTMPANNLVVYAGWRAKTVNVTVDPNGGRYINTADKPVSESTTFTLNYGGTVESAGSTVSIDGLKAAEKLDAQGDRNSYILTGWYVQNADGTESIFDYNSNIRQDITIKAHWKKAGSFKIRYLDTPDATKAFLVDEKGFADQAEVTVLDWPSEQDVPKGKQFIGWSIRKNGKLEGDVYKPGDMFILDANDASKVDEADDTYYVTLVAQYTDIGTTYITYDANGGTGTLTQDNIPLNKTTTLSNGDGFSREHYKIVGWNKDQNAATNGVVEWKLGETVGVDGENGNTLYAVWKPVYTIVINKVDSNNQTKKLAGAEFQLLSRSEVAKNADGESVSNQTTNTKGEATFGNLYAGTYTLNETTVPDGYNKLTNNGTTISVGDTSRNGSVTYDSDTHTYTVTITNTPGEPLPNTGGTGTHTFTILGLLLLASAGALITLKKKSIL